MSKYGSKIAELRAKNNLTQADLGAIVGVTPQAISKWEKGLTEPDIDSLVLISNTFDISLDELLGDKAPAHTPQQVAPQPQPQPQPAPQTPVYQAQPVYVAPAKQICGYCEACKKPLTEGDYEIERISHSSGRHHYEEQHTYCKDCFKKKKAKDNLSRATSILNEETRKLSRGLTWSFVVLAAAIIGVIIFLASTSFSAVNILLGVFICYVVFAFTCQCFFDGIVLDILEFFTRSFSMPGVIFNLSLEGIISLILIKITLSILASLLSIVVFLIGVAVAAAFAAFAFPFSIAKTVKNKANAQKSYEYAKKQYKLVMETPAKQAAATK